jgi:hypothetical protein
MFCVSAPVVLAAGAQLQAKQRKEHKEAKAQGKNPAKTRVPALPATMIIFVGLLIASVIVHSNSWDA